MFSLFVAQDGGPAGLSSSADGPVLSAHLSGEMLQYLAIIQSWKNLFGTIPPEHELKAARFRLGLEEAAAREGGADDRLSERERN